MSGETRNPRGKGISPLDPQSLERWLRDTARALLPSRLIDDLEVRHLIRVVMECSLLLNDVYSDRRIRSIMKPDRAGVSGLVDRLLEQHRDREAEVAERLRRLPLDVRVVGDKALFDLGLLGLRRVKGYDLEQLGPRAYNVAGEVLELLAEDDRLREFFKQNRLLMLPLEEEVVFLRQCAEKFPVYADLLQRVHRSAREGSDQDLAELAERVPLMAAAAEALRETARDAEAVATGGEPGQPDADSYVVAARGEDGSEALLARDELLSAYERIVLFSTLDMRRVREALRKTVIDQDAAVEALCDEFSLFAAGTRDLRKPPAYFLVGPTGVGKNHLVESLCRLLEGLWRVEIPVLTIEGPNYTYPSDINELRGATRGFVRSEEDGLLSTFHEKSSRAPFAVILIDEVEKAHPQLRRFFLSIMDRGTTTDNRGRVLNFANCMVFFTSNLGYSDAQRETAPIGYHDAEGRQRVADRDVQRGLKRALSPEFVNRVRMIHFARLGRDSVERILELELRRIARRYEDVHGLRLDLTPDARAELIRRGFSPEFGARHLAATLESVCNVEIAKKIRADDDRAGTDRQRTVDWLREVRAGRRPFDAEEARRRVLEIARARLSYDTIRIVFRDGEFDYLPERSRGEES